MRYPLFLLLLVTAGCAPRAVAPPTTASDKSRLIGKSEAEVIALLGEPTSRSEWKVPEPDFGPKPNLPAGTRFTNLYYADHQGQQWHIQLVAPDVYRQHKGTDPGTAALYVIEVATYPKGAVF